MLLGERIRKVRRGRDLTQQAFASRIGIKQNSIALIESGKRNASEQVILSICREFGVNEEWLRTGEGSMFVPSQTSVLEELAAEHNLSREDCVFIEKLLQLKPEKRHAVMEFMIEFAKEVQNDNIPGNTSAHNRGNSAVGEMSAGELHAELDQQLAEEKEAEEKSGVS